MLLKINHKNTYTWITLDDAYYKQNSVDGKDSEEDYHYKKIKNINLAITPLYWHS